MSTYANEREVSLSIENAWAEAIVKVWRGEKEFHDQLISDPRKTLEALGAQFEENVNIKVVNQEPGNFIFVIPSKPRNLGEFETEGMRLRGGACPCTVCSTGGGVLQ